MLVPDRPLCFDADVVRLWGTQTAAQIAAELSCSVATVYNAAHRNGLSTRDRATAHRWTAEEDAAVRILFPVLRPCELEQHFGLTFEQVRTRAKRLRLRSRQALAREAVQHDFFGRRSAAVAYFAGLIAVDGWIGARRPEVNLALKESDRAMVDRFRATVGASREVRVYSGMARASVSSRQMVDDLAEYWGVRPGKTYRLGPPPDHERALQLAYIAGHLDGDAFIGGPSKNGAVLRCGAIGTEAVIRWIAAVLDDELAEAGRSHRVSVRQVGVERRSSTMFEWRTSDHSAVVVLDALRSGIGDLGIDRKWATYESGRAALKARQLRRAA